MTSPDTVEVLGVRFHNLNRSEAAHAIARLAQDGHQAYVVKPYSEFMPRAARDPEIRSLLNGAALCLADGVGIVWAAHYLSLRGGTVRALWQLPLSLASVAMHSASIKRSLAENMAGVDLTWQMLAALEQVGGTIFLLGGTAAELSGTKEQIHSQLPRLRIVGAHTGHFDMKGAENDGVIAQINSAAPNALLVAMGFPLQESWIASNLPRLKINVAIAEGGSFSFISGATRRAPLWMRRAGLEWLFRLLRQPWRLRRQLALPAFVWLVLNERMERDSAR